jgi:protein gp37
MGEITGVSWAHHSLNLWIGCEKVSAGCTLCYAERMQRVWKQANWGSAAAGGTRTRTTQKHWDQLLKWNAKAIEAGERRRVFINSQSDFFEDWTGPVTRSDGLVTDGLDPVRRDAFLLFDLCQNLNIMLLTKRPENIYWKWHNVRARVGRPDIDESIEEHGYKFRKNVWLLTSVENQDNLIRLAHLRKCRELSPVLGLSCEPLLGHIALSPFLSPGVLDYVIAGGESGADGERREMDMNAFMSLFEQCQAAKVPWYSKQDSGRKDGLQGRIPDAIWNVKQFPTLAEPQSR